MLPVGRKTQAGTDVVGRQFRTVLQNISLRHAGRQPGQHIVNGNPQASDAGLTASFTGLQGDDFLIMGRHKAAPSKHAQKIIRSWFRVNAPGIKNRLSAVF
jgi:hypothetical protein